jgi:hypothetical protein
MIAVIFAAALGQTPVMLSNGGDDDMLSVAVHSAIENAFNQSPLFRVVKSGGGGLEIFAPNTNVLPSRDGHSGIDFSYSIHSTGQRLINGAGHCTEQTISACADIVLSAASKLVTK